MSIAPHRLAYVLDRMAKGWTAEAAGLVARTLHPFNDHPVPPRRLEKAVRKRARAYVVAARGHERHAEESMQLARSAVVDYIAAARMAGADAFVEQWTYLLEEFDAYETELSAVSEPALTELEQPWAPPVATTGFAPMSAELARETVSANSDRTPDVDHSTGRITPDDPHDVEEFDDALLVGSVATYVGNAYVRDITELAIKEDPRLEEHRYALTHLGFKAFCIGYVAGLMELISDGLELAADRFQPRYVATVGDAYVTWLRLRDFDDSDLQPPQIHVDQLKAGRTLAEIVSEFDDWSGDVSTFQLVDWVGRDCFGAGFVLSGNELVES